MRWIVGDKAASSAAASPSQMGRFETCWRLNAASQESHSESISLFREALRINRGYADAMVLLASTLGHSVYQDWIGREARTEALVLSREAVRLDRNNPTVLAVAACCEALYDGSYDLSDLYAEEALRVAPDGAHVRLHCGVAFAFGGRCDEAISNLEAAIRLHPPDGMLFRAHMDPLDRSLFRRTFRREHPACATRDLAAALGLAGRIDEAQSVVLRLLELAPTSSLTRSAKVHFRHDWQVAVYVEGLRRAGLPEHAPS